MKDEQKEHRMSERSRMIIRAIGFILALGIAIFAFTRGAVGIGRKSSGYQLVQTDPDEEAVLFASDFEFRYYLEGTSNEIKQALKELQSVYSPTLCRYYKLLDSEHEYTGYSNLATLNAHIGEDVCVNAELLEILKDAYAKTLEAQGFNMFAGAYYKHWDSILMLEEPMDFDPLVNADEAHRLETLADMTSDLSHFAFRVVDEAKGTVRIDVDDEYMAMLREQEESTAIVDMNLLREAYILDGVADSLTDKGYTQGYLGSAHGVIVSLPESVGGQYVLYGYDGDAITIDGTIDKQPGSAYCTFRNFAVSAEELRYYDIRVGGRIRLRSPFPIVDKSFFNSCIGATYAIADSGHAADAAYMCCRLNHTSSAEDAQAIVNSWADKGIAAYTLVGEDCDAVHTDQKGQGVISVYDGKED